jgi:hypothetical protein
MQVAWRFDPIRLCPFIPFNPYHQLVDACMAQWRSTFEIAVRAGINKVRYGYRRTQTDTDGNG